MSLFHSEWPAQNKSPLAPVISQQTWQATKRVMNISPMQLTVAPNGRQQSPTRAELELQVAHYQQAAAQAQQETAQAQEATAQAQQELADSRKRDYSNMAGQQSDDDSDEEDTSATTWPRQMDIGTFVPILVGKFEELEWTSERPIRNPSAKTGLEIPPTNEHRCQRWQPVCGQMG